MENIVYLTGAGFSAPLGLPVLHDFYKRSKDIEEVRLEFDDILKAVDGIHKLLTYYEADLLNIEEILSIIEMQNCLGTSSINKDKFQKYICSVIKHYTPAIEKWNGKWEGYNLPIIIYGKNNQWPKYGALLSALSKIRIKLLYPNNALMEIKPYFEFIENSNIRYSIVTLNYDCIMENIANFLSNNYSWNEKISISNSYLEKKDKCLMIAKLHGSIDNPSSIISPTWNKNSNDTSNDNWKLAYKLLSEANHIRILGYSLPESDTYIKYLLKAAVLESKHLKAIDIICLDKEGKVEERYNKFIKFRDKRFKNDDIINYLNVDNICTMGKGIHEFNKLEGHHEYYMTHQDKQRNIQ